MRPAPSSSNSVAPRVRPLGLALLAGLIAQACTATATSEGDRLYHLGEFNQALQAYEAADDGSALSGERVRLSRYMVYADGARELLHLNRPQDAVTVLDYAEGIHPGHPFTAELRDRASRKIAEDLILDGRDLLENGEAEAAVDRYTQALSWDPASATAKDGLVRASALAEGLRAAGQRHYDQGLEEMDAGNETRALTAFVHATTFWGEDNRADDMLEQISSRLARESRDEGSRFLRLELIGPAWVALLDADRLQPGDPETASLLARIEDRLRADDRLVRADMAARAGEPDFADALLDEAQGLAGEAIDEEVALLRRETERSRQRRRYVMARSTELDRRIVEAAGIYDAILAETGEEGFEDVVRRARLLRARIDRAETAYEAALRAEAAGDRARYAEKLAETVRLAPDFRDAAQRLSGLSGGR